ncbi:thymidine phosphorylase [Thalassotalea euphylliae]|uniref:Thymidine phosphorylase n=1 Tax=Thalassotalea euphylliae TaxID=1655234 RepID=A0A3E0TX16_9GAMM|nr:thymidine phosphorylase [Thalassotalea euphylliae]REL28883.1 thymidine phosphorylase [Thalassotalea euphylliae]
MLLPQEVIRVKRNGGELTQEQIQFFVDGITNGQFNDAQVGSMAMAIFQKGMATQEIVSFTQAMMHSGTVLSWPELDRPIVDKHSTGGVGDKVSFMLAAIVGSCGAYMPMIAGRGLGHTGGTVDKLEAIAGFNTQPTIPEFKALVKELGIAIIGQTNDLAPADKRLYGIRDITATVESIPLITGSILSKKLASGLDALVMDVKVGNGAMMQNMDDAVALAQSIANVANGAGVKTQAIITDMNQVLGNSAGNALEIIETVDYLTGAYREERLHNVTVRLAQSMLINTGIAGNEAQALEKINHALDSGAAAELFSRMIHRMGGPANLLESPWDSMTKANNMLDVTAPQDGYIAGMDTRDIGLTIVGMGGGRTANDQAIDHTVGFDQIQPIGTKVSKGDVVARVHGKDQAQAESAAKQYLAALSFSEQAVEAPPEIYQIIS